MPIWTGFGRHSPTPFTESRKRILWWILRRSASPTMRCIGVSTYSWVASWLSESLENIYLAVSGLFNPMQKPSVDLLPFWDTRYKFFLFPINYAVALDQHVRAHSRIAPFWRLMPHQALQQQFASAPRFARDRDQAIAAFDENFYLENNADVAAVALARGREFALAHYTHYGFQERRLPMRFDPVWYAAEYPLAAFEVAQGDYAEFADHFVAIGKARGYRPYEA